MERDPRDIDDINRHCQDAGLAVRCAWDEEKGRILRTTQPLECGVKILAELPLLVAAEADRSLAYRRLEGLARSRSFVHEPLWYWAALCSLSAAELTMCEAADLMPCGVEEQAKLSLLCSVELPDVVQDVDHLVDAFWSCPPDAQEIAAKLRRFLSIWLLNCFERNQEDAVASGFSTFFLAAFVSHSCRPNCVWHYDTDHFVLRAREHIDCGGELTMSYLPAEALLESTTRRREQLQVTKRFLCRCECCASNTDAARGFVCPACKEGVLFAEDGKGFISPRSFSACQRCGFAPTPAQRECLLEQEARVAEYSEQLEQEWAQAAAEQHLAPPGAERLLENVRGLFAPCHWLRDRICQFLIRYYEGAGYADLALPLAQQRVDFIATLYPGLSSEKAWALEKVADLWLLRAEFSLSAESPCAFRPPPGLAAAVLKEVCMEAGRRYSEAAEILAALYGQDSEFHIEMRERCAALTACAAGRRGSGRAKATE